MARVRRRCTISARTWFWDDEYMAPEQIVGDPHRRPAPDVYGLGVVMFRVFTGHTPVRRRHGSRDVGPPDVSPAPPACGLNEEIIRASSS